jgi:heptaprenyl diphosphate synthase
MNAADTPRGTQIDSGVDVRYDHGGAARCDHGALIPFLAAMCFFLSAVEYAIPKPVPILRLGLANLPVMLALSKLRFKDYLLLVFVKVASQAFVSGTIFSYVFVFSASGSLASALAMFCLNAAFVSKREKPLLGYIGLSAAGSLANNASQIVLARFFLFGEGTRFIAPLLLIAGCVTGIALGVWTQAFTSRSRWFASIPAAQNKEAEQSR